MKLFYLIALEKRSFKRLIKSTNFNTQYKEPILVGMLGTISVYQGQNYYDKENFYLCTKGDNVQYLRNVDIDTPIEEINFDNELVVCLDEVLADYFSAYTIEGKTKQIKNI